MATEVEQPSSMVYVQASELFPKKTLVSEEDSAQVPFPELCGESVEYLEKTSDALLALSNFRLFIRFKDSFVNIPLRLIESVEMRDLFLMDINCKDARSFRILFDNSEQCLSFHHRLTQCISPVSRLEDLFAFAFHAWCLDSKHSNSVEEGEFTNFCQRDTVLYSFMSEVRRMGFDNLHDAWRITDINSNFELCSTYPKLHVVPAMISDKDMEAAVKFRTSGRFPSVVWRHMTNGAVIARCSQPEVGWFGWRSQEDENLLHAIGTACSMDTVSASLKKQLLKEMGQKNYHKNGHTDAIPNGDVVHEGSDNDDDSKDESSKNGVVEQRKVLVVDARAYTAAVVNRAKGGGCECEEYYPGCEVLFMNLANIHTIRKSFHSLRTLCSGPRDAPNWWSSLEKTNWLHHISLLLKATNIVVNAIHKEQRPVVVHCSDGWDRTTQIVALAELMLDPYYRTIEGFQVLVTREWLEFGHRFADRCGHGQNHDENQRCPVFLQWLDCVHQLTRQFPCSFEFNETFLVKLAQHVYSCLFGTFLCNSESERLKANILKRTFSVWSLLKLRRKEFKNYLYSSSSEQVLQASCQPRCLQLWSAVYLAYPTPYSETVMENGDTSDYGDSVSSACITPISPVFPSVNGSIDQDEEVVQTSQVTASKSDGNLMCKDCFKNQHEHQNKSKQSGSLDRDLKSKSCPECRTSFSQSDVSGSTSTLEDSDDSAACDSKSLYVSTTESCAASVVSCEDSVNEIESSSMSSSTATVILDPSEGEISVDNGTTSSTENILTDNSLKETQEEVSLAEEPNLTGEKLCKEPCDSEHSMLGNSNCTQDVLCDEEGTECVESTVPPSNCSSDSTLTSSAREAFPSTSTLRPSSSELFTRYLDVDGLTHVSDPVQDRLRQIEMAHQAKVESLRRQLQDVQRRRAAVVDGGASGRTSDLADEVCSLPESNVSGDHPPLSLASTDEGSWIQVDENEAQPTLWVPDHAATNCAKCDTQFWIANRKHHCRNCGLVFCGTCSEKRLPLPEEQLYDPVRVCFACFEKLVTLQERENGERRQSEVAGS